jgi:hypothetical protein
MRVVSQLNETPDKLSLDRLRRVQQRAREDFADASNNGKEDKLHQVALFSNVALWLRDGDRHKVQLARVHKMFKLGARGGKLDIQHPIPLSTVRNPKVFLVCKLYDRRDRRTNKYFYLKSQGIEKEPFPLTSSIISVTSLVQDEVSLKQPNPPYDLTDEREDAAILEFVVREYKRLDANREGSEWRLANQRAVGQQAAAKMAAATNPMREDVQRAEGARRATCIVPG